MVFVTVGTHEQPFNRLVEYMDNWADGNSEEVIIQTGYSTYEPRHCSWQTLFPYPQMLDYAEKARIVVTHGGPSSFIMALQAGKTSVVVPRKKEYGEHVNNHQVDFCRQVARRQGGIIVVEEIDTLFSLLILIIYNYYKKPFLVKQAGQYSRFLQFRRISDIITKTVHECRLDCLYRI